MRQADQDDPNKSVMEYLHYYCDPDSKFDYAVMLKGKWGSGKTHLLNEFLKQREEKDLAKNLYVSLYGLTSFRQIEQELYRQLHPVLSSRGMKIAAVVGKGLLKATTKIDWNGDGKDDVTINSSVPELDLMDYFKTPNECLLIFDDLERCSMRVSDVLGYINSFVEHEGFKSIIIANEDEILRRDAANTRENLEDRNRPSEELQRYSQIKEKLIGQTLKVRSSVRVALPHFLTLIRSKKTEAYLKEHLEDIYTIHSQSETENLRLLKQALWDFERFSSQLTDVHWASLFLSYFCVLRGARHFHRIGPSQAMR